MTFWRAAADGVSLQVKVQPKSRRPGLGGTVPSADGPRLRIGVTEAAEDGRANRAVCELLAEALAVPRADVQVAIGTASREKVIRVTGDTARLQERLARL